VGESGHEVLPRVRAYDGTGKETKKSSLAFICAIVGRWDDLETSDLDANYNE